MKIYLKNVKNVDENLGIINTKAEQYRGSQIFIPEVGDLVGNNYRVVKRVWEKFGESLIVWVEDLEKSLKIPVSIYKRVQKGFMKSSEEPELLETRYIKEYDLSLLPRVSDILEGEERLQVKEVIRKGGLSVTEVWIIVEKY